MNNKFTYLFSLLAAVLFSSVATAQNTGDYRSVATGTWSSNTTWQQWNGSAWVALTAGQYPTLANALAAGFKVTIQNGNTVTYDGNGTNLSNDTVNRIEVMSGGALTIADGGSPQNNLYINQDTLLVHIGGALTLGGFDTLVALSGTPTPILIDSGTFHWTSGGLAINSVTAAGSTTTVDNPVSANPKQLNANFTNNGTINWAADATSGGIFLGQTGGVTFTNTPSGVINENFTGNRGFGGGTAGNVVNNGIINKNSTNNMNFGVNFTNAGKIQGATTGNVGALVVSGVGGTVASNTGSISPGNGTTAGILTVDPLLLQGTSAMLAITISSTGAVAGTNYDQVVSSGNLNLNGITLKITDNAGDLVGQTYTVITTTSTLSGSPTPSFTSSIGNMSVNTGSSPNTVTVQKIEPLPLTWGSFNALAQGNGTVTLNWSTLQEENTARFVVERATNGGSFTSIGTVAAAGNSAQASQYSFVDAHPALSGTDLYRLQEVDLDGKINYSSIRAVSFKDGQLVKVLATPNPTHDLLQLTAQGDGIRALFVDALGHTLHSWILQNGYQQVSIQDVPAGEYQLLIYQNNQKIDAQHIVKF